MVFGEPPKAYWKALRLVGVRESPSDTLHGPWRAERSRIVAGRVMRDGARFLTVLTLPSSGCGLVLDALLACHGPGGRGGAGPPDLVPRPELPAGGRDPREALPGDLPRQGLARTLAHMWHFAGVLLVAFFTAQMTTSSPPNRITGPSMAPENAGGICSASTESGQSQTRRG